MNVNRLRMISDKGLTTFKNFLQCLWYTVCIVYSSPSAQESGARGNLAQLYQRKFFDILWYRRAKFSRAPDSWADRKHTVWYNKSSITKALINMTLAILGFDKNSKYRGSPHRTEKWEAENTVLCETVLFLIEYRDIAKTVLCETLLHNNPYYARNWNISKTVL